MTKMIPPGFSGGIERRQYPPDLAMSINAIDYSPPQSFADGFAECPNREDLVSMLEQYVAESTSKSQALCVALVELKDLEALPLALSRAVLNAVGKIFRPHLRPQDLIVRYRKKTLALILFDSEEAGGWMVCARLGKAISRRLFFGKESLNVKPVFGVSSDTRRFGSAGESLLSLAEFSLEKLKRGKH